MAMRLSGLMSGMDTESIVAQLVEAKKVKVTKAVKAQKSLKYKQDAWKTLNTQIRKLYDGALSNLRFESSYRKKTTKVSNSNVVSVITGENAMNSVQSLKVEELARTGFLTGGKLENTVKDEDGNVVKVTGKTTLADLGLNLSEGATGSFTITAGGKKTDITVSGNTTLDSLVSTLREAGVNANLDETNQRLYISAKSSGAGEKYDFQISSNDGAGFAALEALGLGYGYNVDETKAFYTELAGRDLDTETQKEMDVKLLSLTNSRTKLLATRKQLLDDSTLLNAKLQGTGIVVDENFDYDKLDKDQKAAFNKAVKEAADEAKANGDDEKASRLAGWASSWKSNSNSLKRVEEQLDTTDPANIKLSAETAAEVRTQVEQRKEGAEAALKALKAYDGMTEEQQKAALNKKAEGRDAKIYLNGVEYTSDKNTFAINGLTLTVSAKTAEGEEVTITTEDDITGVYDMVKNFIKEYNTLINQMDKLYNAESAKGYEPLTDEEKEAMSDSQIEEWEEKITGSILRRDGSLNSIFSAMKRIMSEGVEVNGKMMYLSNFGINTQNYFAAPEFEKNAYHIDGDSDDSVSSGNADVLKSMIASDPDTVISFFTKLSNNMREEMFDLMKGTEYSSVLTAYDDKKMQVEYDEYTTKIKELEKKLADYEDKWYAKFAAMETALAKMQNNASAVTSLLGG